MASQKLLALHKITLPPMKSDAGSDRMDESLLARLSEMSPGSQRWLKTALQAIVTTEPDEDHQPAPLQQQLDVPQIESADRVQAPASLEDVINGQADLRDHLKSYPELAEELEGLADVIDLLREAGESRRKRGEQILREEILGDTPEPPEDGEQER